MIDIHTHILPNICDGSRSLEESLEILENAKENGVTDIVLTPHYIENSKMNANNKIKLDALEELKKVNTTGINLYLGNEIYITDNILNLKDDIMPINNTRYLLIELPRQNEMISLPSILFKLIEKGYKVIIAHPERYDYVQKNPNYFDSYINMGVLLQGNISSLTNYHGKSAKKTLKKMLKNNKITVLASDSHRAASNRYNDVKKVKKYLKVDKFNLLTNINPKKILNNEDI